MFFPSPFYVVLCGVALGMVLFQQVLRRRLPLDQYFYIRDLSMAAVLGLLACWSDDLAVTRLVGVASLSLYLGLLDQVMPSHGWRWLLPLPAFLFALIGTRIQFLRFWDGYLYLSPLVGMILTTAWLTLFPFLLQKLDAIPGLVGHLMGVTLTLMTYVTMFKGAQSDLFRLCLGALFVLGTYWSRLGHHYRTLGQGLCNLWGTIIAGISLLGVTKVATLTSLFLVPLACYAVPLIEFSLGALSAGVRKRRSRSVPYLYSRFLEHGIDHPSAVRMVTGLCLFFGVMAVVNFEEGLSGWIVLFISIVFLIFAFYLLLRRRSLGFSPKGFWGISLDGISMNYALSRTLGWIKGKDEPMRHIVTLNALGMNDATEDPSFATILRQSDLNLPDGAGLVWAMKLMGVPVVERVSGCDFMGRLCRLAAVEGFSVYLFGGKPGVAARAADQLQKLYPGLKVAGTEHGYVSRQEKGQLAQKIKASGAKALFVALGMPAQERWIAEHRQELEGMVAVGVGGSFDIYSGDLKRAPKVWSKLGLEWLYRLIQEPSRFKRDLGLAKFVCKVLVTKFWRRGEVNGIDHRR